MNDKIVYEVRKLTPEAKKEIDKYLLGFVTGAIFVFGGVTTYFFFAINETANASATNSVNQAVSVFKKENLEEIKQEIKELQGDLKTASEQVVEFKTTAKLAAADANTTAESLGRLSSEVEAEYRQLKRLTEDSNLEISEYETFSSRRADFVSEITASIKADARFISQLKSNFFLPIGTIVAWYPTDCGLNDTDLPNGWVPCNGKGEVLLPNGRSLKIPNLNGERRFLRGSDQSGTEEDDEIGDHKHEMPTTADGQAGAYWVNVAGQGFKGVVANEIDNKLNHAITTAASTGEVARKRRETPSETRPVNMSVVWIIRVK